MNARRIIAVAAVAAALVLVWPPMSLADEATERARAIYQATGVRGGLVVHVGCGDGKLTAALRAGDRFLVHGLDKDASKVTAARRHIRSRGLCGKVSVDHFDGRRLPYADELVNLLVAEDLGPGTPGMDEVRRVLVPNGVAYVKSGGKPGRRSLGEGDWAKTVKPWPAEIDEWTHFLHDASNNAVAKDTRVGPPRRMKWVCGPLWSRSHEFISSVAAMVSGGGRVFYVIDEGLTSLTDAPLPERWVLTGRDAFNGVRLWKRPLDRWRGGEWRSTSMRGRPGSVPRRIVADGQRLYATLSHSAPLSVLDAATGKTLRDVDGTDNTQEILLSGRRLVLRVAGPAAKGRKPSGSIVAVDADAGRVVWRTSAPRFAAQSLAVADGRVVYSTGGQTVCLSLADGKEQWRRPPSPGKGRGAREKVLVLHGQTVLEGDGSKIVARSAKTGETLWTVQSRGKSMRGHDLFVAQGLVWHAAAGGIAGYDPATGKVAKMIDASAVQSAGHHLRCYRAKATERYLITQYRGAELISLTDKNHVNNDWVRGACRYGIMPCNGLLYVPPNPCFCYPGVKLTGMLALASGGPKIPAKPTSGQRLRRGAAYGRIVNRKSKIVNPLDWPTYRHDGRRSGATTAEVPAKLATKWRVKLPAPLTPPVACDGRLYVAAKDEHTLYALHAADGREVWQFTAGGRIDSPPTVCGGLILFGCADGAVYCLRALDGELAWRFRAAPAERRIVAFNQLESPWRVHGSVLLEGRLAYFTAGRSTFLDGGIRVFALDVTTGKIAHETRLDTWSPTRKDAAGKPFLPPYHIEGTHSDILVGQGGYLFLGQYKLDRKLAVQDAPYVMRDPDKPVTAMDITKEAFTGTDSDMKKGFEHYRSMHRYMETAHAKLAQQYKRKYGGMNMGDRRMGMHVTATGGFLDDTWFNRTYWMYSANWPGWYLAHRGAKSGQILVVGPKRTYALQGFPTRNRQSPLFKPGGKGYLLLADDNDTEPVLDDKTRGATKGMGYTRLRPPAWYKWVPVRIRGMVLAAKHLFVAGPPDVADPSDPMAAFEGRKGAVLRAYSADEGKMLAEHKLDTPPVFDGLIAVSGRLLMCTTDGRVVCLAKP